MSALLIYFILTSSGTFEFFAVEHINSPAAAGLGMAYCKSLTDSLARDFDGKVGNMVGVCTADLEVET